MISFLLRAAAVLPRTLYAALKRTTKVNHNKVLFLSRMSDEIPLDFHLLIEELESRDLSVEIRTVSRRYRGSFQGLLGFFIPALRALFHLANAKVCVLDSYWPHISLLKHRSELTVFQVWHSLGKVKRSGHQTLGRPQGRNAQVSRAIRLHTGYDYIVAGAPTWNPYYVDSFGLSSEASILNLGLPRADYLRHERDAIAERILSAYPEFRHRKVVLYAPTFRRGAEGSTSAHQLVNELDLEKYILIVKDHHNGTLIMPDNGVYDCPDFSSMELLTVSDFLVTDYSAIAIEAAVIDVKTFYYVYDLPYYTQTNGLNIDLEEEMPGCVYPTASGVATALEQPYPEEVLRDYKEKFTLPSNARSATSIADALLTKGGLCRH